MEYIFRVSLLIAGVINLIPSFLAFLPSRISDAYGIVVPDVNSELLLRHRAVLFGIIGGLLIYSSVTRKHYELTTLIGLISMVSFLILFFLLGDSINIELANVMRIDVVATVLLLVGFFIYKRKWCFFTVKLSPYRENHYNGRTPTQCNRDELVIGYQRAMC